MSLTKENLVQKFLGLLVFFLGATVVLGWLIHVPSMVTFLPGSLPMVFNTGLCFAIAGLGLCVPSAKTLRNEVIRTGAGLIIIILCSASFVEHLADINFGIDLASLHNWYQYGNVRPGRMAPNTAFGFITMGMALLLLGRVTTQLRAICLLLLTYLLLAIGLTGLAGYALGPDLLFGWALSARMALHTAGGMLIATAAIGFSWQQSGWYRAQTLMHEEQKIAFSSTAMLIVATIIAGLTGFVTQQQTLQTALEQNLQTIVESRATAYHFLIKEGLANVRIALFGDQLITAARQLLAAADNPQAQQHFATATQAVSGSTFSAIVLLNKSRQPISVTGEFDNHRVVVVPITAPFPTTLGWSAGRYKLHTEVPVTIDGQPAGVILLEQTLTDFQKTVLGVDEQNSSKEIVICASQGDQLDCYPSVKSQQPFFISRNDLSGKNLPITHGIAGETGIVESIDYRGNNVDAAYTSLGSGFGLVVKTNTVELFSGIRKALEVSALLIAFIALAGATLLQFQLRPLTTRLRETEKRLNKLARFDSLTGLPNRYELNERLENAIRRRHRSGKRLAVLFLDVDHFKAINDTMGHAVGDAVLKEFAERLLLAVRETDTVARLAGDEFVIILEGLNEAVEADTIAQKIIDKVRHDWRIENHQIALTTSIGVACGFANELLPSDLLALADAALYRAKAEGRDTFVVETC